MKHWDSELVYFNLIFIHGNPPKIKFIHKKLVFVQCAVKELRKCLCKRDNLFSEFYCMVQILINYCSEDLA